MKKLTVGIFVGCTAGYLSGVSIQFDERK